MIRRWPAQAISRETRSAETQRPALVCAGRAGLRIESSTTELRWLKVEQRAAPHGTPRTGTDAAPDPGVYRRSQMATEAVGLRRPSNWAFTATITVDTDMKTAPRAGESKTPVAR